MPLSRGTISSSTDENRRNTRVRIDPATVTVPEPPRRIDSDRGCRFKRGISSKGIGCTGTRFLQLAFVFLYILGSDASVRERRRRSFSIAKSSEKFDNMEQRFKNTFVMLFLSGIETNKLVAPSEPRKQPSSNIAYHPLGSFRSSWTDTGHSRIVSHRTVSTLAKTARSRYRWRIEAKNV